MKSLVVIIPARGESERFPYKIRMNINKRPMFHHVAQAAYRAKVGPVYVATDDAAVKDMLDFDIWNRDEAIAEPLMVEGNIPTGSDRVAIAADMLDKSGKHFDYVMNLQADIPFVPVELIQEVAQRRLSVDWPDIVTAAHEHDLIHMEIWQDPDFYQVDFDRKKVREHIGIYAFKRESLKRFHAAPQSEMELKTKLECNRGGFTFDYVPWPYAPMEVNTPGDAERIYGMMNALR
jgi:3-deoxy-manno-octulosonate cytidylyltransferase (CMP-KDO synthetase)